MQIFGGSSNQVLVKRIAEISGSTYGNVELARFENGEAKIRIAEEKIHNDVALVQSLSMPVDENLLEFCFLADALNRLGTTNITGIIPWLGYSKQDKVFLPGEALSAKVVAGILQACKMKKLVTFDLHNQAITGFFDIPVMELSAKPIFMDYFRKNLKPNTVVVAPDEGAVKSSSYFSRELGVPIVYMDKRRDLTTGKVEVSGMSGAVENKDVIVIDDLIVTGSTMIETANYLKAKGAKSVSVAATHHLYVPGVQEKLEQSQIDVIVVTDTVRQNSETAERPISQKLKILSVAKLIAKSLTD